MNVPLPFLVCFALCTPSLLWAQDPTAHADLQRRLDAILSEPAFENAHWGAHVLNLDTGEILYRRNDTRSFIPASVTKLYTTSAALDLLGPDYRYRTEMYIDGGIYEGVLEGNVIVRGSGDPVIGGRFNDGDKTAVFRAWADSLRALGIHRIAGDIIGDDDIFDDIPYGNNWSWDDLPYWYAAEISGLSFNDNTVNVSIRSRQVGEPGRVSWDPHQTDFVTVVNSTMTTPSGSSLEEGYHRVPGTNHIELTSLVPQGRTDQEALSIANPTRFFAHILRETLLQEGIVVTGRPVDIDELSIKPAYQARTMRKVAVHTSPPLSALIEVINKDSQNLYAEQVLKTLASAYPSASSDGEPGSAERGIAVAMETFARAGLDTMRLQLVDGSGLSRLNLVTAEMTARLLRYMWHHPDAAVRAAFYESLPIGGKDGTLETRFRNQPGEENVRAKTGTMTNVSALSGYISTMAGTPLAFVLMCNNYTVRNQQIRGAQDRIVNMLAGYAK